MCALIRRYRRFNILILSYKQAIVLIPSHSNTPSYISLYIYLKSYCMHSLIYLYILYRITFIFYLRLCFMTPIFSFLLIAASLFASLRLLLSTLLYLPGYLVFAFVLVKALLSNFWMGALHSRFFMSTMEMYSKSSSMSFCNKDSLSRKGWQYLLVSFIPRHLRRNISCWHVTPATAETRQDKHHPNRLQSCCNLYRLPFQTSIICNCILSRINCSTVIVPPAKSW